MRRGLNLIVELLVQPAVADVNLRLDVGELFEQVGDALGAKGGPVVRTPRSERSGPQVRPFSSVMTVAFLVFVFFLPETNARRPGLFAPGRRTWTSVPSIRRVTPAASA
ncbi:hypothetical protein QQM39_00425 [Streptomyces sp. DT2A-34]|uniref:hypothetical protein n=1 Tax=Streptomyces sp. DT2A-34 TaxID=3051182 RepID=UPI00265C6166|nr:hypothetical protein [Streptomyces sp. DT2A-34]MDO0909381.1 hypothetical protein [Streptomyces sp. DT2A-34]